MGKINVLSFAVANLIAAGEVVDRPASAVKELLENAIDSGADRITVEIQNGGVTFMRVADNGCGMDPDDLPVAVRRHATSKIKTAEDLEAVGTLGFRGEALAAIAAVSNMRIISRTAGSEYGAMLEVSGGNILGLSERACAVGTTVIVEDLFANVPARRKFLKRDVTEAAAVSVIVEKVALSKPSIAFKMIIDGNVKFETAGDGELKNTIYAIYGREFAGKLIAVASEMDGIEVKGFIGRSDNFKANRNFQNFFINSRYVKSRTASAALEQAYSSYIPTEKFPCCVLNIVLSPRAVDVNVHPAKLEVKFSNEKPVFDAVYYTVRAALEEDVTKPAFRFEKPANIPVQKPTAAFIPVEEERKTYHNLQISFPPTEKATEVKPKSPTDAVLIPRPDGKEIAKPTAEPPKAPAAPIPPMPKCEIRQEEKAACPLAETIPEGQKSEEKAITDYRIIGEAFHSYVFVEAGDKVFVIDKHAAHERILFEELRAGMHENQSLSQLLMLPVEVMLTTDEIQAIADYKKELEALGFQFELCTHSAEISAIPSSVEPSAVCDMFIVIADRIISGTGTVKVSRDLLFEKALYQASCKAAIKAGREYPKEHIQWLVDKLMKLPDITFCPHGRPVAVEMTKNALDRQFERK